LAYVVIIHSGQKIMKTREKFVCRRALIAWNFVLAGFSIFGAVRLMPEFIYFVKKKGLEGSFCSSDWQFGVTGGWGGLFLFSKLPEFFDTLFIVARKQRLIFLHWYHHATVKIYLLFLMRKLIDIILFLNQIQNLRFSYMCGLRAATGHRRRSGSCV